MIHRINKAGILTVLFWFVLLVPSIAGYLNNYTPLQFYRSYLFAVTPNQGQRFVELLFFACTFAGAFFIYWSTIRLTPKPSETRGIFLWAMVFTLMLIFLFPFACQDVYYYIASGRLQSFYRVNPYLTSAHQIANWSSDPFLSTTGWGFLTSMYGPLWTQVSGWIVSIAGNALWLAVLLFKLLAGLVHLLNVFLIGLAARSFNLNPGRSMMIYGWNPLLLFELPGHAHNEALLLTFIIMAVYSLSFGRGILAVPGLTLASLVKYTPVLLIPFFSMWLYKTRRYLALLWGFGLSTAVTFLIFSPYWEGFKTLAGLLRQMNFYSIKSLHFLVTSGLYGTLPQYPKAVLFMAVSTVLNLVFLALLLKRLKILWSTGDHISVDSIICSCVGILILYLFLANKWFQPWYLAWTIPLAALIKSPHPLALTALLLTFSAEMSRLPQMLFNDVSFWVQFYTFLIAWVPLVALLPVFRNRIFSGL